jgi:uncharacterized NAD(P)/FAD-binding protein YdhS
MARISQVSSAMTLSPALREITYALEAREDGPLAPSTLKTALQRSVTLDDVAPFIRFEDGNYVRSLVTRTDRWEVRLLCWKARQRTSLHGHGDSACAFRIIRGSANESVLGERDRTWTPGAVVDESSSQLVHQLGNAADDPLLTLHAYSPPLPVETPSPRSGRQVVIVGGGFAGAALAYHLLQRGEKDLRIAVVERGPWFGRGVAYGVDSSTFRLNVAASRMSIDPEVPNDFVAWAHAGDDPHAFLERARYGGYVVDRLGKALRRGRPKLRIYRNEAVALEGRGVRLSNGEVLDAHSVVLATGIAPRLALDWLASHPRIVDAWDECGLATLPDRGRLLILGAGLSALDIVTLLARRDFRGTITILSRNGLLPRPHLPTLVHAHALSNDVMRDAPKSLGPLIHWVRGVVERGEHHGQTWQESIDSLRPHITTLWRSLPPRDRARFVRKVRPFWDVLRHRAPHDALELVDRMRSKGRLEIIAGRVMACEPSTDGLDLELKPRGGVLRRERYDAIVRCIGPALEHSETETSLIRSFFEQSLAAKDPAGLGLVTDDNGALVNAEGSSSSWCFALGAHRRASLWESTSVPEIARHAHALATRLIE